MCAAAFLHNRDEDDGGRPFDSHWITRVCYALGSGMFTRDDRLDPGKIYVALTGPAIHHFGARNMDVLESMWAALGRSEKRRVGNKCGSTCRFRGSPGSLK